MTDHAHAENRVAWWQLPIVWMVLGGPAAVVLAGFATLAIAIRNPDPVLPPPAATAAADLPAVQARNHAASPAGMAQQPLATGRQPERQP